MTKVLFSILFWAIVVNLATGILIVGVVDKDGNRVFNSLTTGRLPQYNATYSQGLTTSLNGTVNPIPLLQDKGNAIYRVLDMIHLGFIQRFVEGAKTYIYGSVQIFDGLFGGDIAPELRTLLFGFPLGVFYILMDLIYGLGIWQLWTGRELR